MVREPSLDNTEFVKATLKKSDPRKNKLTKECKCNGKCLCAGGDKK